MIAMKDHFGIASRARGKVKQHTISFGYRHPLNFQWLLCQFSIKINVAGKTAHGGKFNQLNTQFLLCCINKGMGLTLTCADHSFNISRLNPILNIFFGEQMGGWNSHCANFVKAENCKPELIIPLQNEHDSVTLANSCCLKKIGRLSGILTDILEGEKSLLPSFICPDHRPAFRLQFGNFIYHIVCKIKIIRCCDFKVIQPSFGIKAFLTKLLIKIFYVHSAAPCCF